MEKHDSYGKFTAAVKGKMEHPHHAAACTCWISRSKASRFC